MNPTWMVIRGSGIVAYLALALATIWGLLLSTNLLPRSVGKKSLTLVHESLSVGGILATIGHMVALYLDEYVEFDVTALLVPGRSEWRSFAVSLGIMALYGAVLVTVSFYVRDKIGQQYWRMLHYLSFGVFASVTLHGILAGTDRGHPVVAAMYGASVLAVVGLTALRIIQSAQPESPRRTPRRAVDRAGPNETAGAATS